MNLVISDSSVMSRGDTWGRYTVLGIYKAKDGYQKYAQLQDRIYQGWSIERILTTPVNAKN